MIFVVKYVSLMPIQIAERARPGARGDAQASILLPGVCPIRSRLPPSQVLCFIINFWLREASRIVVAFTILHHHSERQAELWSAFMTNMDGGVFVCQVSRSFDANGALCIVYAHRALAHSQPAYCHTRRRSLQPFDDDTILTQVRRTSADTTMSAGTWAYTSATASGVAVKPCTLR